MEGVLAGAVVDLVAATGAGGGDDVGRGGLAHGGEEDEFADLHGEVVVFPLVAEGTGHAAAAAGDGPDRVVRRQGQGGDGGFNTGEGLLEAVAVQVHSAGLFGERTGGDAAGPGLTGDEFLEEVTVGGVGAGGRAVFLIGQVDGLVTEGEDAGGFDPDHGLFGAELAAHGG